MRSPTGRKSIASHTSLIRITNKKTEVCEKTPQDCMPRCGGCPEVFEALHAKCDRAYCEPECMKFVHCANPLTVQKSRSYRYYFNSGIKFQKTCWQKVVITAN